MWTAVAFCWTTRNIPTCSVSAGTELAATISKMQSFQQIKNYSLKLCARQAKSNTTSARRTLYQKRTINGIGLDCATVQKRNKATKCQRRKWARILNRVSGPSPNRLLVC